MIGSTVANRYARALYELAEEKGLTDQIGKNLAALSATWGASEELSGLFRNPKFSIEEKRRVIKAVAERQSCHLTVVNTMQMLSDRGRLEQLPAIADAFERISERRSGRIRAEIVTAIALPEAYYEQLQKKLELATGKKVTLVRSEDPSLIGGVVTTVGGRVFDGSLKNRLQGLKNQLLSSTDPALAQR